MISAHEFTIPNRHTIHFTKTHIRTLACNKDCSVVAAGGIDSLFIEKY